jgi:release factor glutamine methyltransferase
VDFWARVTETDPSATVTASDRPVEDNEWEDFCRAIEGRVAGKPPAYATGLTGFRRLDLRVGPAVLIPRPETEGLVQQVLDWAETEGRRGVAVDIGTGSGCIALSLAVEGSFARILATDISDEILGVARENLDRIRPDTPVDLRCGEFFAPLKGELMDVIVANPPYVTPDEFEGLEESVRLHEPRDALVSDEGGMRHTRLLLEGAAGCLAPGGLLALEIDAERGDRVLHLAERCGWEARIEEDVFGRPRYLVATAPIP